MCNRDARSERTTACACICYFAVVYAVSKSRFGAGYSCVHFYARNGGDTGKSFAAESESSNAVKVGRRCDFAGCMRHKSGGNVFRQYSGAVVGNRYFFHSAVFYRHRNCSGTGVNAIFDKLFDYRQRAFDNFACRYSIIYAFVKKFDFTHFPLSP